MLTVFIVDDETPIREEIKSLDWAAVHATVIGEAPNGRSALERCRILSPDIVLVDIEMPVMDGLTFTEHLKQILPDVQVIFLTCHQDFSYAKMGISLGIVGYVIKSLCMEEDLFPLIEKASQKLQEAGELAVREKSKKIERLQKLTFDLLDVRPEDYAEEEYSAEIKRWLPLPCRLWLLSHTHREISGQVSAALLSCLNGRSGITAFHFSQARYIILEQINASSTLDESAESLLGTARDALLAQQHRLSFYISEGLYISTLEAYCAGIRAFDLLDQYYFYCETPVIAFPYTQNIYHRECLKDLTGFLSSIEQEKPALRDFCLDNNIPPEELKTAFISALYKRFPDSLINKADYTKQLYLAETFNTAIDRYICFLHTGENRKRLRPEVAAALNYIERNYSSSITLSDAADAASISPDYLSRLFKGEIGRPFHDYLNRIRVEKAIELLETTNLKVYEIARNVGIDSYRYFLVIFRKITGKSPTDYQKK